MIVDASLVAVVTGGASGLGAGTVAMLRAAGATVTSVDLPGEAAERAAARAGAAFEPCDVADAGAVAATVRRTVEAHGAPGLVVNCAGILPVGRTVGRDGAHDPATFARAVSVNLVGTFLVGSGFAAHMIGREPGEDGERGLIVNTASIAATDGQVGQVAYAASKAGVAGMTLPMARDLAPLGVRVVTIAPGLFETPMVAGMSEEVRTSLIAQVPFPKRLGAPADYAALVAHLAANRMINGEIVRLDGAIRMGPR